MKDLTLIMVTLAVLCFAMTASGQTPARTPVEMNDELWTRLVARVMQTDVETNVSGEVVKMLNLGDGSQSIRTRQVNVKQAGRHYSLLIPAYENKDVVIFSLGTDDSSRIFLSDKKRKLLAAAINDKDGMRLVPLNEAGESFTSVLKTFAQLAAKLAPSSDK